MTIKTLDGQIFKNMLLAGAQSVIASQEALNKINVFPVPDGDTGSNMAAAFESIVHAILNNDDKNLSHIASLIADAALNGSRGNSGAIIAQFFQGLMQAFGEHDYINMEAFAKAADFASTSARNAISNPIEGTIITVMRDWAEWLKENWIQKNNFSELLQDSLIAANDSLARTPEQLKILLASHVVDAGAQGFVNFLQGATDFLLTEKVPTVDLDADILDEAANAPATEQSHDFHLTPHAAHHGDLENQYCTECIIHGNNLNIEQVKQQLNQWGDSLVVIGGKNKIKIHIHTNAPNKVFRFANQYGEVLETKADDMWAQYRATIGQNLNKSVVIVTDSSCNLPQSFIVKHNIIIIPLQVIINNKAYLDRVNLTNSAFVEKLKNKKNTITTSQPTVIDIKAAFNKGFRTSPIILGVFLSSKLSGTFSTIENTAKHYEEEEIYLYDSKNITGGLGLIAAEAANAIQESQPLDRIKTIIETSIKNTCTFSSFETIAYVVKGGRMKKSTGFIAKLFRLLPVVKVSSSGVAEKIAVTIGKRANRKKMLAAAFKFAKPYANCAFIVSHVDTPKEAKKIAKIIEKKFKSAVDIVETTPILATHAGPGTIAVSVLGRST